MAQIGNVHPDSLVPAWHAARQLTPEETETVGRILRDEIPDYIAEREVAEINAWLERLPPIPPRRADRIQWVLTLEGQEASDFFNMEDARKSLGRLRRAIRERDYRTALYALTGPRRVDDKPDLLSALRPAWTQELQAIREALDARYDDAIDAAVKAAAQG